MSYKSVLKFIIVFILSLSLNGCISSKTVYQGEEAVLIYQPWFFGRGGVDKTPVKTGQTWVAFTTKVVKVNIKPYIIDEQFDDLICNDNNPVDFKFHFIFQNIAGKTPILVAKFGVGIDGKDWYRNNLREAVRNMARDFTKSKKMFEMTTDKATIDQMQYNLTKEVNRLLKDKGIPVRLVRVTVGKVFPPRKVVEATIATAVQKQNVKTQRERTKAEKARKEAEIASAAADKAYAKEFGMTPNQFLRLRALENQRTAIDSAGAGKIKLYMIIGSDGVQPMIDIKR